MAKSLIRKIDYTMTNKTNSIRFSQQNTSGFTLIEVMVASVILFSVIATVSMVYRGAFLSSEKANSHINLASVLPAVLATIQQEVQACSRTSETEINQNSSAWQVNYQWSAKLLKYKAAPEKLDVDSGNYIKPPLKYKLWEVFLILELNGLSKQYTYNELGWTDD